MEPRISTTKGKDTSSLAFDQPYIRRSILISSWLVILFGVPLWWFTTAIERLPLPPASRISNLPEDSLKPPLHINFVPGSLASTAKLLTQQLQLVLGDKLDLTVDIINSKTRTDELDGYTLEIVEELDHPIVNSRSLSVSAQDASIRLPDLLYPIVFPYGAGYRRSGFEHLVTQYASRYRLAFTLLNEDAAAGKSVTGWDVRGSLHRHILPVLHRLSALHSFTLESQVHFHAPLAFEPITVMDPKPVYGLTQDDLKVFVNSAEWSLASQVSSDPVLHFVMFVPSPSHTPLRILDGSNEVTPSTAFILPQWGGVVIANQPINAPPARTLTKDDLDIVFATFSKQLQALLGVSELPSEYEIIDGPISKWQLDTLYRQRASENNINGRETLKSILKLVDQIPNMPVGHDVRDDFQIALDALEKAQSSSLDSPLLALQSSARAVTHASRAFFSPGMLALLYFPPEHTYAVYTPLFVPMMGPLVATAVREFIAWRKGRKGRLLHTKAKTE